MGKLNVFFVDEHSSSKLNGIGTYRNILLPKLSLSADVNLHIISLDYICENPSFLMGEDGVPQICFPAYSSGGWRKHGKDIAEVLKWQIKDDASNIFMLNHSPCDEFLIEVKKCFPKSHYIFVIHDQGWCAPLLGDVKLFKEIVINNTTPNIVSNRTAEIVKDYYDKERKIYELVDKVITFSVSSKRVLEGIYKVPPHKIEVIPNGYEIFSIKSMPKNDARKMLGLSENMELAIFAGRPERYKGIIPLIKAVELFSEKHPKFRCVMCGSLLGFSNFSQYLIHQDLFIFTGFIERKILQKWYCAADIGIVPSYIESFGYSALEMADAGLPLVVSDGTFLNEMYKGGYNAYIAKIGDNVLDTAYYAKNLCRALDQAFYSSIKERSAQISNNQNLIKSRYSTDLMSQSYIRLMKNLV
ncbi:MAG: glycosyltransferase family 4 protein [Muribaculaceae bacterium]|nr:glycosyltransferase family 4 protein [Muribaculaceae bacterium]